jgi:hypothetical protein
MATFKAICPPCFFYYTNTKADVKAKRGTPQIPALINADSSRLFAIKIEGGSDFPVAMSN